ncbi:hypothetical protein F2Q68_00039192 [Brassica cretica]|uniref:Uncharacterized protein n=1 Tax=Brassica cretica TaxID=69181 RepID=A0A8S9MJL2_BRACR|nr:hypothetical protein F2Q68_00039192 [Brassica cretica]
MEVNKLLKKGYILEFLFARAKNLLNNKEENNHLAQVTLDFNNTTIGCLDTFPFLFFKVLPIRALSTSIGSTASSECALVVSGGLAEGLGYGMSALRQATSIFGICTRTSLTIDVDINRAGRMWVSCCELLVSHNPHGIARCSRLHSLAPIDTNAIRQNSSSFLLRNLLLAASPASPLARNHHL